MSTYSMYGDDVLFGGTPFKKTLLGKFLTKNPVVSVAKFVINPIKESKAAIKTIARFDPTAKTAKYGNITKGVLATAALTGAAILTGGTALAVAGGIAGAAGTGLKIGMTPVRQPAPRITPAIDQGVTVGNIAPSGEYYTAPANAYIDPNAGGGGASPSSPSSVASYSNAPPTQNSISPTMIFGVVAVVGVAVLLMSKKKVLA
jgi:hypothetical protein